jgi:hypothetical protein
MSRLKHGILSGTRVNWQNLEATDVAKSETRVCHGDAFPFESGTHGQSSSQKARLGGGNCDAEVIGSLIYRTFLHVILTYDASVTRWKPLDSM